MIGPELRKTLLFSTSGRAVWIGNQLVSSEPEKPLAANHKDLKIYFSKEYQVKNEAEIIFANGAVLRPDRVAMKDNSVVVIDYKTGLMSKSHAKQITQYGDALNEIGFDLVTKLLVYTSPVKVVSV